MNESRNPNIFINETLSANVLPILQACYATTAFLAVTSNALICFLLGRRKKIMRQSSNKFIFGLSVSGLIEACILFLMPSFIIPIADYILPKGLAGDIFCRLISSEYLLHVPCYLSVQMIASMGIERWYAVVKPTKYKRVFSRRNTSTLLFTLLALSFAWPVDYILRDSHISNQSKLYSPCQIIARPIDFMLFFILETFRLYLPLMITIFCYVDISRRTGKTNSLSSLKVRGPGAEWIMIRRNIKAVIRRKLTYMAFISFIVFVVCWLPRLVYQVLIIFKLVSLSDYYIMKRVVLLPIVFNAFLNPVIYASTNDTIRKQLGLKTSLRYPRVRQPTHLPIIGSGIFGLGNRRGSMAPLFSPQSLGRFSISRRKRRIDIMEALDSETSTMTAPKSNDEGTTLTRIIEVTPN
ncbi:Allatostatin-A receptor [Trichoplax sp. H2]|nr:Allatostatin-A receptor [Trichoplax sp. H2]|eukprot:RDD39389.1 Allatostatin-A receptor [Trichoplax sp. H2]